MIAGICGFVLFPATLSEGRRASVAGFFRFAVDHAASAREVVELDLLSNHQLFPSWSC